EPDLDAVALDRTQRIEQIVDVETDLDFLALVRHLHLILGFLLLWVMRLEGQEIWPYRQADPPVLLVRKDGGALQGLPQCLPIRLDRTGWIRRDDPRVLRETTIDQLRSEANLADLGSNVIGANRQLDVAIGPQNALQLEYSLSRDDDLVG